MSNQRINKLFGVVGGRGTGKTDKVKEHIKLVLRNRPEMRILVIEMADTSTWERLNTYADPNCNIVVPKIEIDEIPYWKHSPEDRLRRTASRDTTQTLEIIDKYLSNTFLILEDATRYFLNGKLTENQRNVLLDSKQKNIDTLLVFHLINKIPLELCSYLDYLTFFKTGEYFETKKIWTPEVKRKTGLSEEQFYLRYASNKKIEDRFPSYIMDIKKMLRIFKKSTNDHINHTLDVRL